MATSKILITPKSNVCPEKQMVKDITLVKHKEFDSHAEQTLIGIDGKERKSNLMNVSVYDDTLVLEGVPYVIIHMLTIG